MGNSRGKEEETRGATGIRRDYGACILHMIEDGLLSAERWG